MLDRRALLALAFAPLLIGSAVAEDLPTKITIATEGAYPPWNFTNADETLGGYEIELTQALCAKMRMECTIVAQEWNGIIPGLSVGKYDAIIASGPLILLLAEQLRRLGVKPVLIARTDRLTDSFRALRHVRPAGVSALLKGLGWLLRLRLARVPMLSGICDLRAGGQGRVETVGFTVAGRRVVVPCDLLVVHDGIVPAIDLAHGAGLALAWDAAGANWCPRTGPDGAAEMAAGQPGVDGACRIRISGDARGIGGADVAIAHGRLAGLAVVAALEGAGSADFAAAKGAVQHAMIPRAFIDAAFPVGIAASLPDDATIICRCEEITAGTLRAHIRAGLRDINQIRGITRCGMGPCQGRSCTVTLARLIAEDRGCVPQDPLPFRARPPLRPLSLGALANLTGCDPALAEALALDDKPQAVAEEEPHAAAQ